MTADNKNADINVLSENGFVISKCKSGTIQIIGRRVRTCSNYE